MSHDLSPPGKPKLETSAVNHKFALKNASIEPQLAKNDYSQPTYCVFFSLMAEILQIGQKHMILA